MRKRSVLTAISLKLPGRSHVCIFVLVFSFLIGTYVGFRFSSACGVDSQTALSEYLKDFCLVMESGVPEVPHFRIIGTYFIYVLVVFVLGFSPFGVILVPVLFGLFGFGTMFTVMCFVRTFSRMGIFLAMALLLIRVIFTLVCFLLVAVEALPQSARIVLAATASGKRCDPVFRGGRYFGLFVVCVLLLFLGVLCEKVFTPVLFRFAVEKILQAA